MSDDERIVLTQAISSFKTNHYRDRIAQGAFLRSARSVQEHAELQRIIMDARASWLTWLTVTQRDWQTKISRRPQRTRNHDSWAARESYVRGGSYTDYLPTKGSPVR